jgi:putative cell wall-binding protein
VIPARRALLGDAISDLLLPDGVVHIVGGPRAVDPSIEDAMRRLGYRAVRHAGADRFDRCSGG